MPTYVYRIVRPKPARKTNDDIRAPADVEQTFEVRQSMQDPPLTKHPETGEPVERVICAPAIASSKLGNSALGSAGFTKYQRMSDGTYERQAGGGGPKHVDPRKLAGLDP